MNRMMRWFLCILLTGFFGGFCEVSATKKDNVLVKRLLTIRKNARVYGTVNGVKIGPGAYGSFVNTANMSVVGAGEDIPFMLETSPSQGMVHGAVPFTKIVLQQTGIYWVWYKVRTLSMMDLLVVQVYRNGTPVFGTDDSGITTALAGVLIQANKGDVMTLRNVGVAQTLSSSNAMSPVAVFILQRVA